MKGFTHIIPIQGAAGAYGAVKYAFAAGTYLGRGGATAPLIGTGLKKVHAVWCSKERDGYSVATTNYLVYAVNTVKAAGTPGSFYAVAGGAPSGASFLPTAGTPADATFKWLALGE